MSASIGAKVAGDAAEHQAGGSSVSGSQSTTTQAGTTEVNEKADTTKASEAAKKENEFKDKLESGAQGEKDVERGAVPHGPRTIKENFENHEHAEVSRGSHVEASNHVGDGAATGRAREVAREHATLESGAAALHASEALQHGETAAAHGNSDSPAAPGDPKGEGEGHAKGSEGEEKGDKRSIFANVKGAAEALDSKGTFAENLKGLDNARKELKGIDTKEPKGVSAEASEKKGSTSLPGRLFDAYMSLHPKGTLMDNYKGLKGAYEALKGDSKGKEVDPQDKGFEKKAEKFLGHNASEPSHHDPEYKKFLGTIQAAGTEGDGKSKDVHSPEQKGRDDVSSKETSKDVSASQAGGPRTQQTVKSENIDRAAETHKALEAIKVLKEGFSKVHESFKTLHTAEKERKSHMAHVHATLDAMPKADELRAMPKEKAEAELARQSDQMSHLDSVTAEKQANYVQAKKDVLTAVHGMAKSIEPFMPSTSAAMQRWASATLANNTTEAYTELKFSAYEDGKAQLQFNSAAYKEKVEAGKLEKAIMDNEAQKEKMLAICSLVKVATSLVGGLSESFGAAGNAAVDCAEGLIKSESAAAQGAMKMLKAIDEALAQAFSQAGDAAGDSKRKQEELMKALLQAVEKFSEMQSRAVFR